MNDKRDNNQRPRRHRGPVVATIDGATDAIQRTGRFISGIFSGRSSGSRHNRSIRDHNRKDARGYDDHRNNKNYGR